MDAKELLEGGQLSAAIEHLNKDVKVRPADSHLRTFLFELLCFAGQFDRAKRQLEVVGLQSVNAEAGVAVYSNVLSAEMARSRLFSEGLAPAFLLDPPPYIKLHLQAVNKIRENRLQDADDLLGESEKERTSLSGRLDGKPFSSFRDSDDLLAPVLEVLLPNVYAWVPFEQITRLSTSAPKKLRDLIWTPATLECSDGITREVFIPVLYAGSSEHPDDLVKLGRMTDWRQLEGAGPARGVGQRVFIVDEQEQALLETREIEFTHADTEEGA